MACIYAMLLNSISICANKELLINKYDLNGHGVTQVKKYGGYFIYYIHMINTEM